MLILVYCTICMHHILLYVNRSVEYVPKDGLVEEKELTNESEHKLKEIAYAHSCQNYDADIVCICILF